VATCGRNDPNPAFIELDYFPIGSPRYYLVADVWNTVQGQGFYFEVSRLSLSSDAHLYGESSNTTAVLV